MGDGDDVPGLRPLGADDRLQEDTSAETMIETAWKIFGGLIIAFTVIAAYAGIFSVFPTGPGDVFRAQWIVGIIKHLHIIIPGVLAAGAAIWASMRDPF